MELSTRLSRRLKLKKESLDCEAEGKVRGSFERILESSGLMTKYY